VRATRTCANEAVSADKPRVVSLDVSGMELQHEAASGRVDRLVGQPPTGSVRRRQVAAQLQGWPASGVQLRPLQVEEKTHVIRTTVDTRRTAHIITIIKISWFISGA